MGWMCPQKAWFENFIPNATAMSVKKLEGKISRVASAGHQHSLPRTIWGLSFPSSGTVLMGTCICGSGGPSSCHSCRRCKP